MFHSSNCVTTRANHWKEQCVCWAEAGQEFLLLAVEPYHIAFMQAVCMEYDYEMSFQYLVSRPVYTFTPAKQMLPQL